jgi:hypothetical protein
VNPGWLLGGEGEPLLAEREAVPAAGWPLPIAKQLLPGEPGDNQHLLSGETYPIAGAFYRPTRYWLEIQRSDPIVKEHSRKVDWGDLLLMETDPSWRKEYRSVDERLCAVCFPGGGGETRVELGLVTFEPETQDDPGYFCVDTFEQIVDRRQLVKQVVLHLYPDGHVEPQRPRLMRKVRKEGKDERFGRVGNLALSRNLKSLQLRDICAVCLMVVRRF